VLQKDLLTSSTLRRRIGLPQIASLLLLFVFLAQCLWFMAHVPLTDVEGSYVEAGLLHIDRLANASSPERSALVAVLAGLPARVLGGEEHFVQLDHYRFFIRLPFLVAGLMLGASLWYVARRLYGNLGGYVALALYTFSPMMITRSGQVDPEILGAWGAFGLIFTAIAVAHTLYAPREVVLWNWRRILMLGLSIAICIGTQFSLWVLLVPALGFMLWIAAVRRGAVFVIFAAACLVALTLLWGVYGFHPIEFGRALAGAHWLEFSTMQFATRTTYSLIGIFLLQNGPGPLLLIILSLVTFAVWKRARFFGTAAPLIVAVLLLLCTVGMQHFAGAAFLFTALPFLILFSAGVSADLLEGPYAVFANAIVVGVLIANAMLSFYGLLQLHRS
jgi:hypothetical protein